LKLGDIRCTFKFVTFNLNMLSLGELTSPACKPLGHMHLVLGMAKLDMTRELNTTNQFINKLWIEAK